MIDGGTFQVGLTVMNFIVSVSIGVACLPGFPVTTRVVQTWGAVLHHLQREVGDVENDIGVAERGRAELAGQPAQAFHVDEHQVDLPVALRAVDGLHRAVVEYAGRVEIDAILEFAHGSGDLGVVFRIVGVVVDAELGAQLRHARIFRRDRALLLGGGLERERGTFGDLGHRSVALAAQLGELRLQFLVELVRADCSRRALRRRPWRSRCWPALRRDRSGARDRGCRRRLATSASGRSAPGAHSRACWRSVSARLRRADPARWRQRNPASDSRPDRGRRRRHPSGGRSRPCRCRSICRPGSTAARIHAPNRTSRRRRARSCDRNSAAICAASISRSLSATG